MTADTINNPEANQEEFYVVGTRIGKCDICKTTKKTLMLSYGFNLCEDCINICALILEQLPIDEKNSRPKKAERIGNKTLHPLSISGGQTQ